MKRFFIKRAIELTGLCVIALGIFVLVSLISYDEFDPSYNHVDPAAEVKNLGGIMGAYIADPLLSMLGFAAFIAGITPIFWGGMIIGMKRLPRLWLKLILFPIFLLASACALATLDLTQIAAPLHFPSPHMGGSIGAYVMENAAGFISIYGYVPLSIIIAKLIGFFTIGLSIRQWIMFWWFFGMIISALFVRPLRALFTSARRSVTGQRDNSSGTAPAPTPKIRQKKPPRKKKPSKKAEAPEPEQVSMSLDADMRDYALPPLSLLQPSEGKSKHAMTKAQLDDSAQKLEAVLKDFGVDGKIIEVQPGPVVTLYALEPSPGTKSSRVIGLAEDIARSMTAISTRIAVIPGRNAIGIELPNKHRETVHLREMLESREFTKSGAKLPLALGKTISGEPVVIDLAKTPHLLVAGTTGSGKSVGINAMIVSLLYRYRPDECKFIMVDPKMLELSVYQDIPHLLSPVVTEPGKAIVALKWTVKEMESRYRLMSNLNVRNIYGYNQKIEEACRKGQVLERQVQTGFDPETGKPIYESVPLDMSPLPFIVVVVDEMADLMLVAGKEIETSVQRLAQMARAAGIHIILATQRPSVDVITGIIKANFPTRLSFQVTAKVDSRTILGEQGAEQLLGMGDMLYMAGGSRITRVHGPFVDDSEVERIVSHLKEQASPSYVQDVTAHDDDMDGVGGGDAPMFDSGVGGIGAGGGGNRDAMYEKAVQAVITGGKASTSYVQRSLKIGYNRAANIVEQMEKDGIVSAPDHTGRRKVTAGGDEEYS